MTSYEKLLNSRRRKSSLGCIWKNNEQFLIQVICPDDSTMTVIHHITESCSNVLTNACARLGIAETDMFGLAQYNHNEYQFIGGDKSLNNIFPKCAVFTGADLGADNCHTVEDILIKTCKMYLRVKHVVTSLDVLRPNTIRYFCEQLRWDVIKIHNLLRFDDFNCEYLKLAFYCLLINPSEAAFIESKSLLSKILPQSTINLFSVDEIVSVLIKHSNELPYMTLLEAQRCFVKLALKLPAVGTHVFQVDVIERKQTLKTNCLISVGANSIRIYCEHDGEWEQYIKWDTQEIDEIVAVKSTVLILSYDYDKEETLLQLYDSARACALSKVCSEIQNFDQASCIDTFSTPQDILQKKDSGCWRRRESISSSNSDFQDKKSVISLSQSARFDNSSTIKRKLSWSDRRSSRLEISPPKNLNKRRMSEQLCGLGARSFQIGDVW